MATIDGRIVIRHGHRWVEADMPIVTVSPKFQVLLYEDRIELIPMRSIRDARRFLQGIDTIVPREPDRT